MSHFGLIWVTKARRAVSVLDAILFSSLAVTLATGLACALLSGSPSLRDTGSTSLTYYPALRTPDLLTIAAEPSVIPARSLAPASGIPQLSNSGEGFRSVFGAEAIEQAFWLSKTNAINSFYGGRWSPENAVDTLRGVELQVKREPDLNIPFSMAEARSKQRFGYGRYEAVMQIGQGSGLVSAFFTYTGPHAGDPHDEVDIEFLGKDTSKVEFNYWRNGKHGKHAKFDLPFDAAAAPHLYAFEWLPDRITWYIDGVAYYSTEPDDAFIPRTPGRLYFSHWTGIPKMEGWHGKPKFESGEATIISCTSFTAVNEKTPKCGDGFRPTPAGPADSQVYATLSP
jgi:endo-1,3-1,4-beta-glycanase ExoK